VFKNLANLAKSSGAQTLRIQATLANTKLYDILVKRYGLITEGGIDYIEIPLVKRLME
jgi:hypothetical protein